MQDLLDYARKNGITLHEEGSCQFCGSCVSRGVFECHENIHRLAQILDFNNPFYYLTRFLSVDAMALQHCEVHGPWNNHLHLTRLFLIFEKNVEWTYTKTPLLSNVINDYKRIRKETLLPPPLKQRGKSTTSDLMNVQTPDACAAWVKEWAYEVYTAFGQHHELVSSIADFYLKKHY